MGCFDCLLGAAESPPPLAPDVVAPFEFIDLCQFLTKFQSPPILYQISLNFLMGLISNNADHRILKVENVGDFIEVSTNVLTENQSRRISTQYKGVLERQMRTEMNA